MEETTPLLSIVLITYNHEKYIREALDSILFQKTNFNFEIVIGDDCSTDTTPEICREYASKHTNINYKKYDSNGGVPINWNKTISRCSGKYIAMLEGDDYWIDENKLQKQVDVLQANSKITLCFSSYRRLDVAENNQINSTFDEVFENKAYNALELLNNWTIPHTASVVFRKSIFDIDSRLGVSSFKYFFCDTLYFYSIAEHGLAWGISDVMSVHRTNPQSITRMGSEAQSLKQITNIYNYLLVDFDKKCHKAIKYRISNTYFSLFRTFESINKLKAFKYLLLAIKSSSHRRCNSYSYKEIIKLFLKKNVL
jgi:glycosyltransferase involved in cell wall biosynthesis